MGYAGGEKANPTYRSLGDHTECFQVDFDPAVVSYDELLSLVWQSHDPTRPAYKVQYASLVLAHDDEQLAAARASAERIAAALGRPLATRIEALTRFWNAEDYHQKYYLRQDSLLAAEFHAMFGRDEAALRESPAAARVNGYIAGDGTQAGLAHDIESLGLGERARSRLAEVVGRSNRGLGCPVR